MMATSMTGTFIKGKYHHKDNEMLTSTLQYRRTEHKTFSYVHADEYANMTIDNMAERMVNGEGGAKQCHVFLLYILDYIEYAIHYNKLGIHK